MVRELDVSQITLRLRDKSEHKGEGEEVTLAKLRGDTLGTLKQCLVGSPYLAQMVLPCHHQKQTD